MGKKEKDRAFSAPGVKLTSEEAPERSRRERTNIIDMKYLFPADSEDDECGKRTKRKRAKKSVKRRCPEADRKDDKFEVTANGIKHSSGSSDKVEKSESWLSRKKREVTGSEKSNAAHDDHGSNIQKRCKANRNNTKMVIEKCKRGESLMCHQCQRNDKGRVVNCTLCKTKRFCEPCMQHWYPLLSEQEIAEKCPVCRRNCNCKACLRKNKVELAPKIELTREDKIKYGRRIVKYLYPWLKEFNEEQISEKKIEARIKGVDEGNLELPEAKCKDDERMYCNKCQTSIVDFHRTCCNCAYDLCLACCLEFRRCHKPKADEAASGGKNTVPDDKVTMLSGEVMSGVNEDVQGGKESAFNGQLALPGQVLVFGVEEAMPNGVAASSGKEALLGGEAENPGGEEVNSSASPDLWIPRADGQIPCPPEQLGGCGGSVLVLQSLLGEKIVSKLLQKTTEIACADPYFKEDDVTSKCDCLCRSDERNSRKAANREHTGDNYVYCPQGREVMKGELDHFQKHWIKGEPVIVRDVLEMTSGLSWEPMVMWRALRETRDKDQVERLAVIAVDCRDWTFTEVNTHYFFAGYEKGLSHKDSWPMLLKLKDWPPESSFDERLPRHGVEFIAALPFKPYTDPKYGPLNLAVKLPEKMLKPDLGPKTYIAYGIRKELIEGDSVTKLHCDMADAINILTHTSEVKLSAEQRKAIEEKDSKSKGDIEDCKTNGLDDPEEKHGKKHRKTKIKSDDSEIEEKGRAIAEERNEKSETKSDDSEIEEYGGALWDIWRREDVPKLIQYLKKHSREFKHYKNKPVEQVDHPIHDQCFYLTMDHKRRLKEECGVEAWTFEQKLGEAVFIPAGCPHQVRNLKSCIKVALDFVSPENFSQCIELSNEFRLLPDGHRAKEDKLEVKKMAIYALKNAVDDIEGQKPKAQNENTTANDRGGQKRKFQPKKTKWGRQSAKRGKKPGIEKTMEKIGQADNKLKEENETENSYEPEKHNIKTEMTIDDGNKPEENGSGNGDDHNEDERIEGVDGAGHHKTQIKSIRLGRLPNGAKSKDNISDGKDLAEVVASEGEDSVQKEKMDKSTSKKMNRLPNKCGRSKIKFEKDLELQKEGNISDSEDPKEKHATSEIGDESMTEDMDIDMRDKPNLEATESMESRKEDVPNEGVCCNHTTAHGRVEKAKGVDAEIEEPVRRKRGRPPKVKTAKKLPSEKGDKITTGNLKDQKNPADKAAEEMLEQVSKAAAEENFKDPCSSRVEEKNGVTI